MNKQAKEIAGQALDKAISYTWTTLSYEQIQELLACHAELIVRKCADIALIEQHDPSDCILKYFGVTRESKNSLKNYLSTWKS